MTIFLLVFQKNKKKNMMNLLLVQLFYTADTVLKKGGKLETTNEILK